MDTIVATDKIVFRGAKGKEMIGLETIAANTGTLFGVSASTYGMWKSPGFAVGGGTLNFVKILRGLRKAAARGLGTKSCLYTSIETWTDVMNDLSALRRYVENIGGKIEQGSEGLLFHGPSGAIECKGHPLLKGGIALGIAPRYAERVGASDITFKLPGAGDEYFIDQLAGKAGVGLRGYYNQALFVRRPATVTYFTGIVNST